MKNKLAEQLYHLAEHIGDDDHNLPAGAKSAVLSAAKRLEALAVTGDGWPVPLKWGVYHPDYLLGIWEVCWDLAWEEYYVSVKSDRNGNEWIRIPVSKCYSTIQAAQAAAERGE